MKAENEGRFVVDSIPPADVEGIEMRIDRREKVVHLRWFPVTTDQQGRPERVAKYKVYRYQKKSFFFSIRAFELGETDRTWFEDKDPQALEAPLVFYKVVAEAEGVLDWHPVGDCLRVVVAGNGSTARAIHALEAQFRKHKLEVSLLRPARRTMEDAFVHLVKQQRGGL